MKAIKSVLNSFTTGAAKLFIWASGAEYEILKQVPIDRNKYLGIGGTIIFTSLMATLAGGYAFYFTFKDTTLAICFGLFWGALIFNLDRYIVSTFGAGDGKRTISRQELIEASPRLFMAIVLGFVIATPLELKLFEKEVMAEIRQINITANQEAKAKAMQEAENLTTHYTDEIEALRAAISGRREELRNLKARRDKAYDDYMCELNGTCGTGRIGNGPVFREAKQKYLSLEEEFKTQEATYEKLNEEDRAKVSGYEDKIEQARNEGLELVAGLESANGERDGLLARLEALGNLTDENSSLWVTKWLITLLFIFIEIAPIMFKMMTERGPYDDILDRMKHEIKVRQMLLQSNFNQEINTAVKVHTEQNEHKLNAELFANQALIQSIAEAQAEIAQLAVENWKKEQLKVVAKNPNTIINSKLVD